jgi:hypothetical protein
VSSWTLEVCGGVVPANQSGSVVSPQGSTTSSSSYSSSIAEQDHESPRKLLLQPSSTHYNHSRQTNSSFTESRHRRAFLFTDPVATELHFPRVLLHNQGHPKVCPDSLNLPNAGNPFAEISSLASCSLFSPDQGLDFYVLEGSRVFFIKFLRLSLFQISEYLQVLCCALELKILICDLG